MIDRIASAKLLNKSTKKEIVILNPREIDVRDLNRILQGNNRNISLGEVKIHDKDFGDGLARRDAYFDLNFEYIESCGCVEFMGYGHVTNCTLEYRPIPKDGDIPELTLSVFQLVLSSNSEIRIERYSDDE